MTVLEARREEEIPAADSSGMRILFARNLFFPEDLGGNRYPFEVVTRLARRGHAVTVLASRSRDPLRRYWRQARVALTTYPAPRLHPMLTYAAHTLLGGAALARRPARECDLLVTSSYDVALAAQWVPGLARLPSLFIYHSEFYSVWAQRLASSANISRGARMLGVATLRHMRWVERRVFQRHDLIVAVSEFSRQQIADKAPWVAERVRVIPTGVDTHFFSPAADKAAARAELGLRGDVPVIIGVGRMTPVKRFDRLIEAVHDLRQRELDAQLVLVGDGPQAGMLQARAADLGLGERFRLTGYANAELVRSYMQAADVQVCSSEFENHSLAILEALATGTPVLGTPAGGTPAILRQIDQGLILPSPEPAAIAGALHDLLQRRDRLAQLSASSRALAVRRYDWECVVGQLEDAFLEARRRRAGRSDSSGEV